MLPFSVALREVAAIPGARYSCVADDVTGDVLAEHGRPGPDPAAAVRWGRGLRAALLPSGELEDVMITADATFHLLRRVRAGERTVIVHVSVDRARGNLALARRTLGAIRFIDEESPAPQVIEHYPPAPAPRVTAGTAPRATVPDRPKMPLPVRTPRRPEPAAGARTVGALPSAIPAPRRPPAPVTPGGGTPPVDVPVARGWSDDLYTMGRLLDALRRMK